MKKKWILAAEQLPQLTEEFRYADLRYFSSKELLGFTEDGEYVIVTYTESDLGEVAWTCSDGYEYIVTHWMPLPSPPNVEGCAE